MLWMEIVGLANTGLSFSLCSNVFLRTVGFTSLRRLPQWAPYPKPFKQTLRVRLAFLFLVCLRKQAFATALKQKSLPFAWEAS